MLLKDNTYKNQQKLANYCRNGKEDQIDGITPNRIQHYRRLVFGVVNDSLEGAFPITFKYIDRKTWDQMVYHFFSGHKCENPQVWMMAREFYEFAVKQNYATDYNIPYLNDLLEFEWLEIELFMMEDIEYPSYIEKGDWLKNKIATNPEYRLIKLNYPVHQFKPTELEINKGEYYLLLFREKEAGRIQFISLSVLFAFIIENLANTSKTLEEISTDILYLFGINDLSVLHQNLFQLITDLKNKGFVLGFQDHFEK